jgi:hypothetical protein
VFDRIRGRGGSDVGITSRRRLLQARDARGDVRRRFCAGLAILSLYVQLFAAGLCGSSFAVSPAAAGAFPICHTRASGSPSDQAPAQDQAHHDCAFCALHCKAAMVLPPSIGAPHRFVAATTRIESASFIVPAPARFPISAPPRGPPASA